MRYFWLLVWSLGFGSPAVAQEGFVQLGTGEGCSVWTDFIEDNLVATWSGACIAGLGEGEGLLAMIILWMAPGSWCSDTMAPCWQDI